MSIEKVFELANDLGGKVECVGGPLPDGSGFAVMSMPLPRDHWIYEKDAQGFQPEPPMPLKLGVGQTIMIQVADESPKVLTREQFAELLRQAGRYAVRGATMGGKEMDFDPDALIQNLVVGALGYHTADGTSSL